jgi:hypothetical protein
MTTTTVQERKTVLLLNSVPANNTRQPSPRHSNTARGRHTLAVWPRVARPPLAPPRRSFPASTGPKASAGRLCSSTQGVRLRVPPARAASRVPPQEPRRVRQGRGRVPAPPCGWGWGWGEPRCGEAGRAMEIERLRRPPPRRPPPRRPPLRRPPLRGRGAGLRCGDAEPASAAGRPAGPCTGAALRRGCGQHTRRWPPARRRSATTRRARRAPAGRCARGDAGASRRRGVRAGSRQRSARPADGALEDGERRQSQRRRHLP